MMKTRFQPRSLLIAACLLLMILTMVVTGPAFASGIAVLLSAGKHSGVVMVKNHPPMIASDASHLSQPSGPGIAVQREHMSLLEVQHQMNFPIYWPTSNTLPSNYALNKVYLYQDPNQNWADGPILELDYQYSSPGVTPLEPGRGKISICEFKPVGKVYQMVMLGAAHQIKIDANGQAYAIYVDGQWAQINQSTYKWQYGERSELIYEHDGVIFWIVGDQRDGIDGAALLSIASSLLPLDVAHAAHTGGYLNEVTSSYDETPALFAGDVIYTDSEDGPSLIVGGDPRSTIRVN